MYCIFSPTSKTNVNIFSASSTTLNREFIERDIIFFSHCRSCSSAQTLKFKRKKKKKSVTPVIDWSTFLHRLTPIVLSLSSKIRSRLSFSTLCFLRRQAKATRSDCSMVLGIASRPNTHGQHEDLRSKHSGNQDDDCQQFPAYRSSAEVTWAASVDFCPRVIVLPRRVIPRGRRENSLPLGSQAVSGPLYLRIRLWSSGFDSIPRFPIYWMPLVPWSCSELNKNATGVIQLVERWKKRLKFESIKMYFNIESNLK